MLLCSLFECFLYCSRVADKSWFSIRLTVYEMKCDTDYCTVSVLVSEHCKRTEHLDVFENRNKDSFSLWKHIKWCCWASCNDYYQRLLAECIELIKCNCSRWNQKRKKQNKRKKTGWMFECLFLSVLKENLQRNFCDCQMASLSLVPQTTLYCLNVCELCSGYPYSALYSNGIYDSMVTTWSVFA